MHYKHLWHSTVSPASSGVWHIVDIQYTFVGWKIMVVVASLVEYSSHLITFLYLTIKGRLGTSLISPSPRPIIT